MQQGQLPRQALTRYALSQSSRSRTSLKTWAYSTSQPASAEVDASTSKCPVARIVNGTKDLFKGFQAQAFDYTPFSASNYQARLLTIN